jgi:hypothetical protein
MDFRDAKDLKSLKEIEDYELNIQLFATAEKHENEPVCYDIKGR